MRLESDKSYTKEKYEADRAAAKEDYDKAILEANQKAADTLAILQQGYYDRADALKKSTEELEELNQNEIDENNRHNENLKSIKSKYNKDIQDFLDEEKDNRLAAQEYNKYLNSKNKEIEDEKTRHTEEQGKIRKKQQQILNDENYIEQLKAFLELSSLYEFYSGETSKESEQIVRAFKKPMENMPEQIKKIFQNTLSGAVQGLKDKASDLFDKAKEIKDGVINLFTKGFDEHSPSKVFKRIFRYALEGGETGLDEEAPKLYKQADDVSATFTKRMQAGVSADGLVAKMRATVSASHSALSSQLTANVNHSVKLREEENDRKRVLKGDIYTSVNFDGRETAVMLAPYMSEELAWEDS